MFCSLPEQHRSRLAPQAEGAGSAQHMGTRIQNVLSGENLSDSRVVFCVDLNLNDYSAVLFSVPAGATMPAGMSRVVRNAAGTA